MVVELASLHTYILRLVSGIKLISCTVLCVYYLQPLLEDQCFKGRFGDIYIPAHDLTLGWHLINTC